MKKGVFAFLIFLFSNSIFALGMGPLFMANQKIEYSQSVTQSFGAACSLKFDTLPIYFEFSTEYAPFTNDFDINLSGDFWFSNPQILPNWNFYYGAGLALGSDFYSNKFMLNFGPRLLVGFNWQLFDGFIELFVQQAAQQNVSFEFGGQGRTFYPLELPFSVGFRVWD